MPKACRAATAQDTRKTQAQINAIDLSCRSGNALTAQAANGIKNQSNARARPVGVGSRPASAGPAIAQTKNRASGHQAKTSSPISFRERFRRQIAATLRAQTISPKEATISMTWTPTPQRSKPAKIQRAAARPTVGLEAASSMVTRRSGRSRTQTPSPPAEARLPRSIPFVPAPGVQVEGQG